MQVDSFQTVSENHGFRHEHISRKTSGKFQISEGSIESGCTLGIHFKPL